MLKKLLKILFKSSFSFKNLGKKEVILFDCDNTKYIKKFFKKENTFTLSVRLNRIKVIYLNKKVVLFILKNLFNNKLKTNYLLSLIEQIKPKLLVTHIDNSQDFYLVAKSIHKKISCLAIQQAHRADLNTNPYKEIKNIFIPNLFCFSDYDKILFRNNKVNVSKFYSTGSLNLAYAFNYLKKNKIKKQQIYDICLVSEPHLNVQDEFNNIKNFADTCGLISIYTHRLCIEENLKLIFVGESVKNTLSGKREIQFYDKYLGKNKFNISQQAKSTFPSYQRIYQSKLTIGHVSTMLREAIGLKKKVLYCNFSGSEMIKSPLSGIAEIKKPSYKEFKKKVLKILSLSDKKYFDSLIIEYDKIMLPPSETFKNISDKIKKFQ